VTKLTVDSLIAELKQRNLKWERVGPLIRTEGGDCPLMAWADTYTYSGARSCAKLKGMSFRESWAIINAADRNPPYDPKLRRKLLRLVKR
jgi:hypothetical protein